MRIYTNFDIIEKRVWWAKTISTVGLACLVIGFIVNVMSLSDPGLSTAALGLLFIGMLAAIVSSTLVTKWVQEPRADQFLAQTLKRLNNDYALFNYTFGENTLLLTPSRLYVVIVRNQYGQIYVTGSTFKRPLSWRIILRLFSADGLGNPVKEVNKTIPQLRAFLEAELPNQTIPPIEPLVVFSHKDVDLVLNEPTLPVLYDQEIRDYIREHETDASLSSNERHKIIQAIAGQYKEVAKGAKP